MSNFPSDSALSVPLTGSADTAVATSLGLVEQEVISLFDQLRTSLLRYLLSFGLSVQDSEEVVQEAFLALFRDLRAGKSRRHLRGWVFRVAHNLALKRCASVRRELRTFLFGADSHLNSIADPAPNPEQGVAQLLRQQSVLRVMDALPELDRRCLLLRAEGLRYREIAEVLEISLGAVSLSLERSLTRIVRAGER
jgi:RNA polymerase sigma-70 factor, ECF subfamily